MRVVSGDDVVAVVERRGERRTVNMLLVGGLPVGTPVLVHLGSAVRVLDEDEAETIDQAVAALEAAARGESVEQSVADLVARGPR